MIISFIKFYRHYFLFIKYGVRMVEGNVCFSGEITRLPEATILNFLEIKQYIYWDTKMILPLLNQT